MAKLHGYHDLNLVFRPMPQCGEDCELHQYERDAEAQRVQEIIQHGQVLHDLAVLLVTVNRAVENNRSSAMVPQRARRRLCEALGVQRLDESVTEIAGKLREALS